MSLLTRYCNCAVRASTRSVRLQSSIASRVCLVIGAGDSTGGAIGKRFAKEGFDVCLVRRNADGLKDLCSDINSKGKGKAYPFGVDARVESQVIDLVERIESTIGPIDVMVHNIGANVNFKIGDTTERVYRKVWEMATLSAFLTGKEVSKRMLDRGEGTIIFTGATGIFIAHIIAFILLNIAPSHKHLSTLQCLQLP